MRTLLCGGLEDLAAGKNVTDVIEQILHFKQKVDRQSPRNEFVVAALLNPPKYTLFEDNGEPSRNHKNLIREIKELNSWIVKFDSQIGMQFTPRLHRLGVKDGWTLKDGKRTRIKRHIFFSVVKQGATKQKISSFLGNESKTWNSCCTTFSVRVGTKWTPLWNLFYHFKDSTYSLGLYAHFNWLLIYSTWLFAYFWFFHPLCGLFAFFFGFLPIPNGF